MLDALVVGTTDPDVLAELARGQLRTKVPELSTSLAAARQPGGQRPRTGPQSPRRYVKPYGSTGTARLPVPLTVSTKRPPAS